MRVTDTSAGRSLDPVLVTAQALKGPQNVPSQGSLVATQPQSIVNSDFIQKNDSPAANYTDIIKFTPSVFTVDPNGPGLAENLGTSIRGFQDGQFNVTFDGIPWGDSNDFTHHSTSYFMPQDIGNVVVDRGPGNAGTLGDATFGGTVYVQSDNPRKDAGATAWLSYGSFKTKLLGFRYDTGTVDRWHGASGFISAKTLSSNGYLSNAKLDRSDVFLKFLQPLGGSTTLSFAANLNKVHQNPPIGATFAQIQTFGANYAYNTDPTSQAYYGYQLDKITTDYEYIGLNSHVDGWTFDNKLYTYGYYHDGWNGEDPNGETPNGTLYGAEQRPRPADAHVLSIGRRHLPRLEGDRPRRSAGGSLVRPPDQLARAVRDRLVEQQCLQPAARGVRLQRADLLNAADRLMEDQLFMRQYYLQYVWHAVDGLDLTGGIKHVNFERVLDAAVNQKTGTPLATDKTYTRNLASFDAHYEIRRNWAVYAQWAQGFLAPNLNVFYIADPTKNEVSPQSTTNVQAGTTWVGERVTVSADVYKIDFNNEIASRGSGVNKYFYNLGGVKYHGVELEGTVNVGMGFAVYGNASVNSAKLDNNDPTSNDTWVPNTPDRTAAFGLLYNDGALQGSLMGKYVGRRYGDSPDQIPLGGYATVDGALNYSFGSALTAFKDLKVGVTMQNIADRKSIYDLNGYTGAAGTPLYFTIPGRSFQVNVTAKF